MIQIVGLAGIGAMKGNGAAGALASCRHTTKRWSGEGLRGRRVKPPLLGADKAAILFNARARGTKYTGGSPGS